MNLAAKASAGLPRRSACAEAGYAMAALLVALAVMAVVLGAAMPTWSHMIRREKEEELIFRGLQYARAINQYQRKFANASPQSLDVLIEQRLLRKKFRDPMATDEKGEFQMLYLSSRAGGPQGTTGRGRAGGIQGGSPAAGVGGGIGTGTTYSTSPSGGIVGVASKNTGTSIKSYKEKTRYNEWQFVGMEMSQQAGGAAGGGPQRGGCPDGSPVRSVTRGGSTFTECGAGGSRDGGMGGRGGFGGRGREGSDPGSRGGGARGGRGL